MVKCKKENSKNRMLEHSLAKVNFYRAYLARYLNILFNSPHIKRINIFDVFCGMGIYEDGNHGSPIAAYEIIENVLNKYTADKSIFLTLNDVSEQNIARVNQYICQNNNHGNRLIVKAHNSDAESLLEKISTQIHKTPSDTRNLVFIDPYGYKKIKHDLIYQLMSNGKTEVIIFLPVSFISRFAKYAILHQDSSGHRPLYEFIKSFFPDTHKFCQGQQFSEKEFIVEFKKALTFNKKFFSASYSIERSKNNYFAMFFVTNHIYGLEKILEVKWELDEENGKGFSQPKPAGLFDDINHQEAMENLFKDLQDKLIRFLCKDRTNHDLYKFALYYGYIPKQITKVLVSLCESNIIRIHSYNGDKPVRKNAYYINYKEFSKNPPKILVSIK